jgi:outer membrane protein assembly factor BamB
VTVTTKYFVTFQIGQSSPDEALTSVLARRARGERSTVSTRSVRARSLAARCRRGLGRASVAVALSALLLLAACGSGGGGSTAAPTPASSGGTAAPGSGATTDPGSTSSTTGSVSPNPTAGSAAATSADWPTYDRTAGRSGVSVTTPTFTSSSRLVKGWTGRVDGAVYAQPLVIGSKVVVATENNSVYAFNSSTGRQLWMRHLGPTVTSGLACAGNINPGGITGTPVADVATNRLFVVTFSPYRHTLWSLNLSTGATVDQRDADGPGSDARAEQARGALALADGRVYIPYGGLFGDCGDYHGWVVSAPVSGTGPLVDYVTPNERQAGIWAPPGPVVGHGSVYVATGNGTPFNVIEDSDSVLRLSPKTLVVQSTFTPSDWLYLSSSDKDLDSTSPALLPGGLVLEIGKDGVAYVLGATRLGGVGGQLADAHVCSGGFGGDAVDGSTVVISCFDSLTAVKVTRSSPTAKPKISVLWSAGVGAGPPVIAGGVVWDATRSNQLYGFRLSDGHAVFSTDIATVVTSFPSLAVSKDQLFVPEGREVVSYRGA